jgi:hypothetical protein
MDTTSSLALVKMVSPVNTLPLVRRVNGTVARDPLPRTGPGSTLHMVYSTLGVIADKQANRAAHSFGLGPNAVALRIRNFFGELCEKELKLAEMRRRTCRKLQRDCTQLMEYALP